MHTILGSVTSVLWGVVKCVQDYRNLAQKWAEKAYTKPILSIVIYISGLGGFYVTLLLT